MLFALNENPVYGQVTLVNFNSNSGSSYFTLVSSAAPNITCSAGGSIDRAILSVTGAVVHDRDCDGTVVARISGGLLSGLVPTDAASVILEENGSGIFPSVSPGTYTVATDMRIAGAGAGNYLLVQPSLTGTINPKSLVIQADNKFKCYDGSLFTILRSHTGDS